MARYIQAPQQQYVSQYVPKDLNFYQQQIDKSQARYDATQAMYSEALAKLYEVPTLDAESRNKMIDQFAQGFDQTFNKYQGDLSKATGDVLGLVSTARKDPFWQLNQHQVEQAKLEQQAKLSGKLIANSPSNKKIINPETGQYATREELTTVAVDRPKYEEYDKIFISQLKPDVISFIETVENDPVYQGMSHSRQIDYKKELTAKKVRELAGKYAPAYAEYINNAQYEDNPYFKNLYNNVDAITDHLTSMATPSIFREVTEKPTGNNSSGYGYGLFGKSNLIPMENTSEAKTKIITSTEDLTKNFPNNSYPKYIQEQLIKNINTVMQPQLDQLEKVYKEAYPNSQISIADKTTIKVLKNRLDGAYHTESNPTKKEKLKKAFDSFKLIQEQYDQTAQKLINEQGDYGITTRGFNFDDAGNKAFNQMQEFVNRVSPEKFQIETGELAGKTVKDDEYLTGALKDNTFKITQVMKVGNNIKYIAEDALGRRHVVSSQDNQVNSNLLRAFGDINLIHAYEYLQKGGWNITEGNSIFINGKKKQLPQGVEIIKHPQEPNKLILTINGQVPTIPDMETNGKTSHPIGLNGEQEIAAYLDYNSLIK